MSKVYRTYVSNPCCKKAEKIGDLRGGLELLLYNPTLRDGETTMTVYFTDREPHTFAPVKVPAESNYLLIMPEMDPAIFDDCGFWGARFESDVPMLADTIGGMSYYHPDERYAGCAPTFAGVDLHTEWHYADGLWRDWRRHFRDDLSKAPTPFNELDYFFFLNPGKRDARVDMTLRFRNTDHITIHLTVPAERVRVWNNYERIPSNEPYAVKIISSEPIATSSVRFIYGLHGFEEWGLKARCAQYPKPGPITA